MPLLISGDAAFAGQGVIAECFGLSGLRGHRTGGSVHFIINNQIGFTTYPRYSRSSPFPSDVAKMIEAPIFHVNGDDPEAVVFAAKVSTEFRQKFQKPVVIDMFCYRRHGHNEGDEPAFTQPLMYKAIAAHPTTVEIYGKKLVGDGVLTDGEVEKMKADWRAKLDVELDASQSYRPNSADWLDGRWSDIKAARDFDDPRRGNTGVAIDELQCNAKLIAVILREIPGSANADMEVDAKQTAVAGGRQVGAGNKLIDYRLRMRTYCGQHGGERKHAKKPHRPIGGQSLERPAKPVQSATDHHPPPLTRWAFGRRVWTVICVLSAYRWQAPVQSLSSATV